MAEERVERRLAAILVADIVGYSRLMAADEEGTLAPNRDLLAIKKPRTGTKRTELHVLTRNKPNPSNPSQSRHRADRDCGLFGPADAEITCPTGQYPLRCACSHSPKRREPFSRRIVGSAIMLVLP